MKFLFQILYRCPVKNYHRCFSWKAVNLSIFSLLSFSFRRLSRVTFFYLWIHIPLKLKKHKRSIPSQHRYFLTQISSPAQPFKFLFNITPVFYMYLICRLDFSIENFFILFLYRISIGHVNGIAMAQAFTQNPCYDAKKRRNLRFKADKSKCRVIRCEKKAEAWKAPNEKDRKQREWSRIGAVKWRTQKHIWP